MFDWLSTAFRPGRAAPPTLDRYINTIIHEWSVILALMVITLVPAFFVLDWVALPRELVIPFALYRAVSTVMAVAQIIVIRRTKPGRASYIHGYLISIVVGGAIALMTARLGGFDTGYYAGLNLVIIGVNLLLPWGIAHSVINCAIVEGLYVVLNLAAGHSPFNANLISNLFFMNATIVLTVSINRVRYGLIAREFQLRTELKLARDALWGEMEIAKKIQTSLLPDADRIGPYAVAARMMPAQEIGGDYFDIIETVHGEHWAAIGDVSGHGVESGLIMMMAQTSILSTTAAMPGTDPATVITQVNTVIRANNRRLGTSRYMTIMVLKLDEQSISLAGKHQDVLVYHAATRRTEVIPTRGTWIGLVDRIDGHVETSRIDVAIGDMILLFTDGVTEAMNEAGELFGQERLTAILDRHGHLPVDSVVASIMHEVFDYQDEQVDDITVLALKRMN